MYPRHEIQNPAYEPEIQTQQNCKNVRKIGLILQDHFHILHYSYFIRSLGSGQPKGRQQSGT